MTNDPQAEKDIKDISGEMDMSEGPKGTNGTRSSVGRLCPLWIHDDNFSKDQVLLNLALFPRGTVKVGDLIQVVPQSAGTENKDYEHRHDAGPRVKRSHRGGEDDEETPGREPSTPSLEASAKEESAFSSGKESDASARYVFKAKEMGSELLSRNPTLQISISSTIASAFGFKNRAQVMVSAVEESKCSASHVEINFRDEYLTRADMWRLVISELARKPVYKGQKLLFMSTIKATVHAIYVEGKIVRSAYFNATTKPIFRSESARYVLFIQMSKEMWGFDTNGSGEIMFNKVINGFLPDLFKRWQEIKARHLVSIILFSRVEYKRDIATGFVHPAVDVEDPSMQTAADNTPYKDFYRVVVSDMASGQWSTILQQLKREFKVFLRDVLIRKPTLRGFVANEAETESAAIEVPKGMIAGHPSSATRGNILEAINLASSQFSNDYIDRDLVRTGISIVVVTPGPGLFEVDYNLLATTTDILIENGIAIDLVCLAPMPLHSVPLFKYKPPQPQSEPANIFAFGTDGSTPKGRDMTFGSYSSRVNNLSSSNLSRSDRSLPPVASRNKTNPPNDWRYGIPHWIDVSFWVSTTEERGLHVSANKEGLKKSKLSTKQHKTFVPRVRMYSVQMMGMMENEMSNISIPYLHQPSTFRQDRLANINHLGSAHPNRLNTEGTLAAVNADPNAPHNDRTYSERKAETSTSRLDSAALQWMDDYDDKLFRDPRQSHALDKQSRQLLPARHALQAQTLRDNYKSLLGTSPHTFQRLPSGLARSSTESRHTERTMQNRPVGQGKSKRKESTASTTSTASTNSQTLVKPAMLPWQISFGLRGFGAPAPKALASTEISSEQAKPTSASNRGLRLQSRTRVKEAGLPAQAKRASQEYNDPRIELLSPRGLEALRASTTRPIAIRCTTAIRVSGHSHQHSIKAEIEAREPSNEGQPRGRLGILGKASLRKQNGPTVNLDHHYSPQEAPAALSPGSAMAPWLTVLNPSNPHKMDNDLASRLGRWQHVYPRRLRASTIKWKSLCSPASIPLTTEQFPTADQLVAEYQESPYRIALHEEEDLPEMPKSREWLVRELISFRLSHGFQIVVGPRLSQAVAKPLSEVFDIFDDKYLSQDGTVIFLSRGSTIHQLSCIEEGEVEVKRYTRRPMASVDLGSNEEISLAYKPAIRTMLADTYDPRDMLIASQRDEYNWHVVDSFIAGHEEQQAGRFAEHLRFWRARFVLIPVDPPSSARRPLQTLNEDNEEEIRLEGIRKLTQVWQRYRYIPPDERRFQAPLWTRRDTNPLDIIYQTRNPSSIIATELDRFDSTLLAENDLGGRPVKLLPDTELYQRSNLNLASLAQTIQGDRGVRLMDRRWHWRLHYNCFIGSDLTTWLLMNFKDVDTREEAIDLGNELMKGGLFQHVEKRHNFRDGNFFYQIASEYRAPRPESRGGWFGSTRRLDRAVPPTPVSEHLGKDSPRVSRSRSDSGNNGVSPRNGASAPVGSKQHLAVALSKSLRYDVDHRKRSYRPEVINLHYDRVHNPDNCYHIQIDWMNVTSKLIEDAIVSWATSAERFGLRLVEVPIGEASTINGTHPFRAPYLVKLAHHPPNRQPEEDPEASSFTPRPRAEDHYYQTALLKNFNFVLDLEAAKDFPLHVEVTYSWGRPDYKYPQYIHRSGVVLAQIIDDGNIILLENKLYNNRSAAANDPGKVDSDEFHDRGAGGPKFHQPGRGTGSPFGGSPQVTPFSSPLVRASPDSLGAGYGRPGLAPAFIRPETEKIKNELEAFCHNSDTLKKFYEDVLSTAMSPASASPYMDGSIPILGLPPSLSLREMSSSPSPASSKTRAENGVTQHSPLA
ncbi:Winged helix-turn-helix DNA-binding domain [Lasallia pustulata]|uniref:Vacuolar membrane-associated protein IML1 n=1 Tax=Lasallia pustulata TaxID=136370 RepID=A0A1W5CT28_9LECA|nr:Winged helix-turn-helix DNA-binding domain [Lasallia pustulata]